MDSFPTESSFRQNTPIGEKTKAHGLCHYGQFLQERGFSEGAIELTLRGWSGSTVKSYQTYIRKWFNFCKRNQHQESDSRLTIIMDFFTELFHGGASHSALASAKAALATFVKVNNSDEWKNDPVLNRFMRGCYKSRVPLPRHSGT